jgi:hypothetical protein
MADPMHHRATFTPAAEADGAMRSSLGGYPVLPEGFAWPVCTEDDCGRRMALFLQVEMEDGFGLPFEPGSTLSVFQCIEHDDPLEPLDLREPKKANPALPKDYWQHANYAMFLSRRAASAQTAERDGDVGYSKLNFAAEPEPEPMSRGGLGFQDIKIGGRPFWHQKPKLWACSCGSPMAFVCSTPSNLLFPRAEGGPRQTNGREAAHFLFLGLASYVFACEAQCDPRAVVAVRQN